MKILPKLNKFELNKKKQQFLNNHGVRVKVDGSWGPWLEKLYLRLTTKNKHYNTTPLGFLSYLYDATLGDGTTYKIYPTKRTEVKEDKRSNFKRKLDLKLLHNNNILGYTALTVLPSAAVAGVITGAANLVNGGYSLVNLLALPITREAIKQSVKSTITNPEIYKTLGKNIGAGLVGSTAINLSSKAITGNTWGENMALASGASPLMSEWTNPGFVIGPYTYNLAKKGIELEMARQGNNLARNRIISRELDKNLDTNFLSSVNSKFRNSEWSNFLSTINGDNYYRMLKNPGLVSTNINRKNLGYFLSHTTPWEEFSGLGADYPTGITTLYEFPTKTFGKLKSVNSDGFKTEYDVTELGRKHLLFGETSSGYRDFVKKLSDRNAKYLKISPYKIGIKNRPLTENNLYDSNPIYENIHFGNLTAVSPEVLNNALTKTSYNIYEYTPNGIQKKIYIPN